MVMFLTLAVLSMLGFAVCAALLNAAAPPAPRPQSPRPDAIAELPESRFFAEGVKVRPTDSELVPVELLVSQIERHVRLEQAAAESFLDLPTTESLHSRTTSALLN